MPVPWADESDTAADGLVPARAYFFALKDPQVYHILGRLHGKKNRLSLRGLPLC